MPAMRPTTRSVCGFVRQVSDMWHCVQKLSGWSGRKSRTIAGFSIGRVTSVRQWRMTLWHVRHASRPLLSGQSAGMRVRSVTAGPPTGWDSAVAW